MHHSDITITGRYLCSFLTQIYIQESMRERDRYVHKKCKLSTYAALFHLTVYCEHYSKSVVISYSWIVFHIIYVTASFFVDTWIVFNFSHSYKPHCSESVMSASSCIYQRMQLCPRELGMFLWNAICHGDVLMVIGASL